jgi:hypothetical protein
MFAPKKMKITLKKRRTMCTPLRKNVVVVRYMFPMATTIILLDEGWIMER